MAEGKKGEVVEQAGSWNEYANVLFSECLSFCDRSSFANR